MLKDRERHIEKTGLKELLWFAALWGLGFGTLVIVGGIIKLLLKV